MCAERQWTRHIPDLLITNEDQFITAGYCAAAAALPGRKCSSTAHKHNVSLSAPTQNTTLRLTAGRQQPRGTGEGEPLNPPLLSNIFPFINQLDHKMCARKL